MDDAVAAEHMIVRARFNKDRLKSIISLRKKWLQNYAST